MARCWIRLELKELSINMIWGLKQKAYNRWQSKQRNGNPKKEPIRNTWGSKITTDCAKEAFLGIAKDRRIIRGLKRKTEKKKKEDKDWGERDRLPKDYGTTKWKNNWNNRKGEIN